jgi:rare lipoprotein A
MQYRQYTGIIFVVLAAFLMSACAAQAPLVKGDEKGPSYTIKGKTYTVMKKVSTGFVQQGIASWYGPGFHGKKTASGEIYDMHDLTAAHNVLPLKTLVKVTNLDNGKEITVRINDRGPFMDDRMLDLSFAGAKELGIVRPGTAPVRITVLGLPDSRLASGTGTVPKRENGGENQRPPNPFFNNRTKGALALLR